MPMRLPSAAHIASAAALVALTAAGCTSFLSVDNPNVVNSSALDPVKDAPTLSLSARENFYLATGWLDDFSAFFTWEAWSPETFPEYNQFGLRDVINTNAVLTTTLWSNLSVAVASNEKVIGVLKGTAGENQNLDLARSLLYAGFSLVYMGEDFCQAVIAGGPPLTSQQVLDTAIARFTRAITVAQASATGAPAAGTEAYDIVNAAYVGKARAELQLGRKPDAATDAAKVAAGFTLNRVYADNPAARGRISNRQYLQTKDRASIVVPPDWRTTDPRVPYGTPGTGGLPALAADGIIPFFYQAKFKSYDTPVRLASRLEADYIAAEATGTSAMLTLINARRAANGLPAYGGATDDASVLAELEEQRGREFYLEGKRLGDFRRNGAAVGHVPSTGQPYFKSGYTPIGSQTCWPLPYAETSTNPNFK